MWQNASVFIFCRLLSGCWLLLPVNQQGLDHVGDQALAITKRAHLGFVNRGGKTHSNHGQHHSTVQGHGLSKKGERKLGSCICFSASFLEICREHIPCVPVAMPPPGTFGLWTKTNPGFFCCFCQRLCHSKEQRNYCMFVSLSSTGISYTSVLGNLYKTITWPDHLPVARADAGTPHWSSAAFKLTWATTLPSFSSCVLSPVKISCPFYFNHQHLHRL